MLRFLVGCEASGTFRRALEREGASVVSVDLLPAADGAANHVVGDVVDFLAANAGDFDAAIFRPTCTRLCRAGQRWLFGPGGGHPKQLPRGKTWDDMKREFADGVALFAACYNAAIPLVAVENPRSHPQALAAIAAQTGGAVPTQYTQPWQFGDPEFKETAWWLRGLPPLVPVNPLVPPKRGTEEYKRWSKVHRASPGADRWAIRSQLPPGFVGACAKQWVSAARTALDKGVSVS